jgi:hypothetical protein
MGRNRNCSLCRVRRTLTRQKHYYLLLSVQWEREAFNHSQKFYTEICLALAIRSPLPSNDTTGTTEPGSACMQVRFFFLLMLFLN